MQGGKVALLVFESGIVSCSLCSNRVYAASGILIVSRNQANRLISLVELSGIEPLTSSLRTRRSPS
jgi:hypothetical protein